MTVTLFTKGFLRSLRIIKIGPNVIQTATITSRNTRGKPATLPTPFPYAEKKFTYIHELFDKTILKTCQENARIIVVEGPIGVGKSAFCEVLAEQFDMHYIPQPNMDDFYVLPSGYDLRKHDNELPEQLRSYDHRNFCIDPKSWKAGKYQNNMMFLRFFQYVDALCHLLNTGQGVILERSYFSDYVFMKAMYDMKYVTKPMMQGYSTVFTNTSTPLLHPHLIIYLDIPEPVVQERIRTRNYSWEQNSPALTKDYILALEKYWKQDYLKKASKSSEILIYDWTDGGDVDVVIDDIEKIDFDPMRLDRKFKDWWIPRGDLCELRINVTTHPDEYLTLFYYPWYKVDEFFIPYEVSVCWDELLERIPECRFAEGYNYKTGDKIFNILFSSDVKNHRSLKSITIQNAKLRHYTTVIRPEALYAAECLALKRKGPVEQLEVKERKILRKILGSVKENNEYRRRHNRELYEHITKISDVIRKRRIAFYEHLARMNLNKLTYQLFQHFLRRKTKPAWFVETEKT